MRTLPGLLCLLLFLSGCTSGMSEKIAAFRTKRLRQYAINVARDYTKKNVQEAGIQKSGGIETIGDQQKRYVLDTSKVFTGQIDGDKKPDALVSLEVYEGNFAVRTEHLILLRNGELRLARVITSDMKVLAIKDGTIIAEVPTKPRSSPLFNCHSCQELHDFRFENDSLRQIR